MKLLGLYAIRFLFYLLSKRVTNIVEILVVLDVIRLKLGGRWGGGGGGGERETKQKPLKISGLLSQKNKLKKL